MPRRTNEPAIPPTPKPTKQVPAFFFRSEQGNEPVREWLKDDLTQKERKLVGEDIRRPNTGGP
jgi:hypothetical protein